MPESSSLQTSENEAAAIAKTSNRVTLQQIEDKIEATEYFHPGADQTATICALTLKNKFTVIGHSACADPANFDAEFGKKLARENAIRQVWALEGYVLCEKLAAEQPAVDGRG